MDSSPGKNTLDVWRSISLTKDPVKAGSGWRIGSGTSAHIWNDNSLSGHTHFKPYSPPKLDSDIQLVSHLITPNIDWDKGIINSNIPPIDANRILALPLPPMAIHDRLVWFSSSKGTFIVKNRIGCLHPCRIQENPKHLTLL